MKKHNRNVFAYIRHGNQSNEGSAVSNLSEPTGVNHNIYNDIIDSMDPDQTDYIKKILIRNEKKEQKNRILRQFAEREKDEVVRLHRKSELRYPELSFQEKCEKQNSIRSQRSSLIKRKEQKLNQSKVKLSVSNLSIKGALENINTSSRFTEGDKTFINNLGDYISCLTNFKNQEVIRQRKTVQKLTTKQLPQKRRNQSKQLKSQMASFQINYKNVIKTLQKQNQQLQRENIYLQNKLNTVKSKAVTQLQKFISQNIALKQERQQLSNQIFSLQSAFNELHSKLNDLTFGSSGPLTNISFEMPTLKNKNFFSLHSNTEITQQDDDEYENCKGNSVTISNLGRYRKNQCSQKNKKQWWNQQDRRARSNLVDFQTEVQRKQMRKNHKVYQKEFIISESSCSSDGADLFIY